MRRPAPPRIIGLTGSIGMGKSATAATLKRLGVPVFDADACVHGLFVPGGAAVKPVLERFPETGSVDTGIDRKKLGAMVFGKPAELKALEAIVHPLVERARRAFLRRHAGYRAPAVVLDVPLLFEAGGWQRTSEIWVASAPAWLQKQRVLARQHMTETRLNDILVRQVPDKVKCALGGVRIPTGMGHRAALKAIRQALTHPRAHADPFIIRARLRRWRQALPGGQ